MANALSLKLRSAGYETEVVYDGDSVISSIQSSKYDLIILDLVMPKKDGFTVLAELKQLQGPPVIVSSNLSQEEDVRRAKELGAIGYFVKSDTTLAEVVDRVKKAFAP